MPARYSLTSAGSLRRKMNETLISEFGQQKYYQAQLLKYIIGISKIFHATALMYMYIRPVPWTEKYTINMILCITATLTYAIQYGISIVWWRNYYATFYRESTPNQNLIVCTHTPWYTGKYHIRIYLKPSTTFFQRLGKPLVDETLEFSDYFTESGYFLEPKFRSQVKKLFNDALYAKNK